MIGLVFTPLVARTVRAAALAERTLDYVQAAKLRGEPAPYIMLAEILPNVKGPIIVEATVRLGYAVFALATLAFLSYGEEAPLPDWGVEIAAPLPATSVTPGGPVLFPALAIASLDVALNLVADSVQQALEEWTRPIPRAPALELRDLDIAYAVGGRPRQVIHGLSARRPSGRHRPPCRRVRLRQVDRGPRDVRYLPSNGRVQRRSVRIGGVDALALSEQARGSSVATSSRWSTRTRAPRLIRRCE